MRHIVTQNGNNGNSHKSYEYCNFELEKLPEKCSNVCKTMHYMY